MLLDNSSIWKHIAYSQEKTGKTKITFINDVGEKDITIASTSVKTNNSVKQISIVGPTRMNYSEVKGLLDYIKDELEKINN
jgi:heat-inducible transcriptional repressor